MPSDSSALTLTLAPLRPFLDDPELTELCINHPGEAWTESAAGWKCQPLPFADLHWCQRLAKLIANASHQRLDAGQPLLSATLPSGERTQIVLPPACSDGSISFTIRKPASRTFTLTDLAEQGALGGAQVTGSVAAVHSDTALRNLLDRGDLVQFLQTAVRTRQNILLCGATGSGKTTWTKALIHEIPPHERLITIEDARELDLSRHPNHVRLYYSKDGQGQSQVTPRQLLEACLRMKPDRILLAELRGEEAFHYLRNVNSGHPGSITSLHAGSCAGALDQLTLLVKESEAGRNMSRAEIREILNLTIDIVIQVGITEGRRCIQQIAAPCCAGRLSDGTARNLSRAIHRA